jgi:hypothetical protein
MSEEVKTKSEMLREELENLKTELQIAAGGTAENVQAVITRMEEILQPTA